MRISLGTEASAGAAGGLLGSDVASVSTGLSECAHKSQLGSAPAPIHTETMEAATQQPSIQKYNVGAPQPRWALCGQRRPTSEGGPGSAAVWMHF